MDYFSIRHASPALADRERQSPSQLLASLAVKWAALSGAARAVAAIASAGPIEATPLPAIDSPDSSVVDTAPLHLAEQCLEDLTVLMATAIAALIATIENGGDPRAAADALLREFRAVESALGKFLVSVRPASSVEHLR